MTEVVNALQSAIGQAIDTGQGTVADKVATVFAEREITRRVSIVVAGVEKLTAVTKSFDSINRPDAPFTTPEGAAVVFTSAKRTQEINAAKKKVEKVTAALTEALTAAKFESLEKVLNEKDGKQEASE